MTYLPNWSTVEMTSRFCNIASTHMYIYIQATTGFSLGKKGLSK